MAKAIVQRTPAGSKTSGVQEYETENRALARRAGSEGIVLLRNAGGLLPLKKGSSVALYGAGAVATVKGGTGSGEVNSRETVSIWQGLKDAGFKVTTEAWLRGYQKEHEAAREAWRDEILQKSRGADFFAVCASTPFATPTGTILEAKEEGDDASAAVFVLSRVSGEGKDRSSLAGDFKLTKDELAFFYKVCSLYDHVVLALNTGGLVDLGFLDATEAGNVDAILYVSQPGMEAGGAFADVLSGAVNPSAKLVDTWALRYRDWPGALSFSRVGVTREVYSEGIYVGYRYFDTFGKNVRFCFGYGLSYTTFDIAQVGVAHYDLGTCSAAIGVKVRVKNTGSVAGRQVVQLYASCPQEKSNKEFRRLVAFGKTRLLEASETEEMELRFALYALASFDTERAAWSLETGEYVLMVGDSLSSSVPCAIIAVQQELVFSRVQNVCTPQCDIEELSPCIRAAGKIKARREELLQVCHSEGKPVIFLHEGDVGKTRDVVYGQSAGRASFEARQFTDFFAADSLIHLVVGDESASQDNHSGGTQAVPGCAAQTSACAKERGLPFIVLADGPAGLRLAQHFRVDKDGNPLPVLPEEAFEHSFFADRSGENTVATPREESCDSRWQFHTAFPVGTQLAQSWDTDLIASVGKAVACEMVAAGVTLWLAPGMNIHRNPLCGRNFEYFSEDPLVSGLCAAAMTRGVQSVGGVGCTIKHFACNNREDDRMQSDSILSERALREIYLKGFEIAIKECPPMAVMTSYNLVNGTHTANSCDLCWKVARCEWGYSGVIMTDWTTTTQGDDCTAAGCIRAGCDLVMPGDRRDIENLTHEFATGDLAFEDLQRSASHVVDAVCKSRFVCEVGGVGHY